MPDFVLFCMSCQMSDDHELRYRFVPALRDLELYEAAARRIAGGDAGWLALRSPRGILFKFDDVEHARAFRAWAERSQPVNREQSTPSAKRIGIAPVAQWKERSAYNAKVGGTQIRQSLLLRGSLNRVTIS